MSWAGGRRATSVRPGCIMVPHMTETDGKTEGWIQPLEDERVEIFLKVRDLKVRASGSEGVMWSLLDWFEQQTGTRVNVPETKWRRARRGPRVPEGQGSLDLFTEPQSNDSVGADG